MNIYIEHDGKFYRFSRESWDDIKNYPDMARWFHMIGFFDPTDNPQFAPGDRVKFEDVKEWTEVKDDDGTRKAEMKVRPILYSGDMVRAILDGRKTMTRRIVKIKRNDAWKFEHGPEFKVTGLEDEWLKKCPYGQVGDRLWVRETIFQKSHYQVAYGEDASPEDNWWWDQDEVLAYLADGKYTGTESGRVRPSIHMPRWASRITLEITNIRVEQIQSITDEDVLAEGFFSRDEFITYIKAVSFQKYKHGKRY